MTQESVNIFTHLLEKILHDEISEGEQLPTEVELAKKFKTNRTNASSAVRMLEKDGWVSRKKRHGTFLNKKPSIFQAREMINFQSKKILLLGTFEDYKGLHWNNVTLSSFEHLLNTDNYNFVYKELNDISTRKKLELFLSRDIGLDSFALVLLPDCEIEATFFMENYDLFVRFHENIYILDNGTIPMDNCPFHRICLDPFEDGMVAAKYILDSGFEDILFINEDPNRYYTIQRKSGLRMGLARKSAGKINFDSIDNLDKIAFDSKHYLIISPRHDSAAEIIQSLDKRGLTPGKDYSLISFADMPEYRKYNITNISPALDEVGRLLGQLILYKNFGKDNGNKLIIKVCPKVIERTSCRRAR
jgi:DNA-binding transcriptional regulator YhcF (GntR family)